MVQTRLFITKIYHFIGGGGGDCCRVYYRSLIVKLVEFIEHGYRKSSKSNESHCVSAVKKVGGGSIHRTLIRP